MLTLEKSLQCNTLLTIFSMFGLCHAQGRIHGFWNVDKSGYLNFILSLSLERSEDLVRKLLPAAVPPIFS